MANETELSEEERALWAMLVDEGREIRAPRLAAKAAQREANRKALEARRGRDGAEWKRRARVPVADSLTEVPACVKRFVCARAAGLSFAESVQTSGARWLDVMMAKKTSEEARCAFEGMEAGTRDLMKLKAASLLERSLDEGARVSLSQVTVANGIMAKLDAEHFGEAVGKALPSAEEVKAVGAGGFVVNLISDAAKAADAAPAEKPKRALVFTDV